MMRSPSHYRPILLVLGLLAARTAAAQSAPVRISLERFRDSLAAADSGDVARIVRQARLATRQSPDDAVNRLRYALAVFQQARTDGRLYDQARNAFVLATQLEPGWVYGYLGVGLSEWEKGNWLAGEPANLGTRVGYGAYQASVRALLKALELEPTYSPALLQLSQVASILRDTTIAREVLEAYRRADRGGNQDPEVLLHLGRLERAIGELDSSATILERLARTPQVSPLARLELARTRLAGHSSDGLDLYYSAAASDDSAVVAEIRADLAPITADSVLHDYDRTEGLERVRFLQQFWLNRDRDDLRPPGDRIAEHYRRLLYARRNFPLDINRRFYGERDLFRSTQAEVDDRGVIYIRQGEPDERIHPLIFGMLPNETWVYHRAGGDLVLHFSSGGEDKEGGDLHDYRLVGSVLDLRLSRDTPMDLVLLSRSTVSDLYAKMMSWGPHGAARAAAEERKTVEMSAAIGTATDSYELQFNRSLPAVANLVSIGKDNGQSLLHLAFAFPGSPGKTAMRSEPIQVRLSLGAPAGSIGMVDTSVIAWKTPSGAMAGHLAIAVPSGSWNYRLALMRGEDEGIVLPRGTVTVPAYRDPGLNISDLGIGREGESSTWEARRGDSVRLSAARTFAPHDDLMLYYELYGLIPGETYQTSIAVYQRKNRRVGQAQLQNSFIEIADNEVMGEHRTIRLADLPPGDYLVGVTVRDSRGGSRISLGDFHVAVRRPAIVAP